jgi:ABC-type nitrate/sulfonate/bicarbonate transport system permease component
MSIKKAYSQNGEYAGGSAMQRGNENAATYTTEARPLAPITGNPSIRRSGILRGRYSRTKFFIGSCSSVAGLLVIWELLSATGEVSPLFLPSPVSVVKAMWSMAVSGTLGPDLGISLVRVVAGFAIGSAVGICVGLLAGWSPLFDCLSRPLVAGGYTVPLLAALPLFVLWLGIGEESKIALIAVGGFFPVAVNTQGGVRATPRSLVLAASNIGASRWSLFRKILLPSALPSIIVGLRLGFGLCLLLVVAAEMLGGTSGIGFDVLQAGNLGNADQTIGLLAVFAILGIASTSAFLLAERLICPWVRGTTVGGMR